MANLCGELWQQTNPDDNILGSPDLVIEVLAPSNTVAAEINEQEKLYLEDGAGSFGVVDSSLRQVKVATPDGITSANRLGQEIPLRILCAAALNVDDIFA